MTDDSPPVYAGREQQRDQARKLVEHLLQTNRVVLFLKGDRLAATCGFSAQTVRLLDKHGSAYAAFDVLADPLAGDAICDISDWRAFPQLFVEQRFVGGYDAMVVLDQTAALGPRLRGEPPKTVPDED